MKKTLLSSILALAAIMLAPPHAAADYPERPIRLIVPWRLAAAVT